MLLDINNIVLLPDENDDIIETKASQMLNCSNLRLIKILKKSLDARNKGNIHYKYRIAAEIPVNEASDIITKGLAVEYLPQKQAAPPRISVKKNIVIIGLGPAGLFSALRLAEAGARVTILERGKPVEERMADIEILERDGILNTESNVLFGEGGAGTYSDGKLTSRSNKPEINWFYEKMIEFGAKESISYESKPHIGTDKLQAIAKNARNHLLKLGSEIHFSEKVTGFTFSNNRISSVLTASGNEYVSDTVILATGHSSREVYELLESEEICLEQKGFAIGVRIEHPAEEINSIQYGNSKYKKVLPTAEYQLIHTDKRTGRAVYSFCMCPGGTIVNSSSEKSMLCTNGMSNSRRDMRFSNSAIVVTVAPGNMGNGPLAGIRLQRKIEKKAFLAGEGSFRAPAQSLLSFLGKKENVLPDISSYRNGLVPAELEQYLPAFITAEMRKTIPLFDRKMKGFISENAVLIGPETRTSSPVRITRNPDFQSVSTEGLYPIGEGAGYSGGIVSSAIDGIKCADSIIESHKS